MLVFFLFKRKFCLKKEKKKIMEVNNVFLLGLYYYEHIYSSHIQIEEQNSINKKVWLKKKILEKKQKRFNIKNVNNNVKLRVKKL